MCWCQICPMSLTKPCWVYFTIGLHHTTQNMYHITAISKELVNMLEHPFGSVFWQVLLCKAIYRQDDGPNERILPLFAAGNVPDEGLLWNGTSGHCLRRASISPANLPLSKCSFWFTIKKSVMVCQTGFLCSSDIESVIFLQRVNDKQNKFQSHFMNLPLWA